MSANVETMAYVKFEERDVPWHGLGTPVDHVMSSIEALNLSGLNWKVEPRPMFIEAVNGHPLEVPNVIANVRISDDSVLGTVSGKYKICQNDEAFDFTDELLNHNVKYETAGSLNNGRRVWMLAKMPEVEIVGDKVEPYLVFTNNHDGKGAITVAVTPIRVVCQNTLALALNGSNRTWSTRHMGDLSSKKAEAIKTLGLATKYTEALKQMAEKFSVEKFNEKKFTVFVETLLPKEEDASDRQIKNLEFLRNDLTERFMKAPDIENFRFTKWGVLSAVSDFAFHKPAGRETDTYNERNFMRAVDGHPIMDRAYEIIDTM